MLACRLIATQTDVNLVVGEDSVVEVLTTATTALRRRLAELERLGGLSWLDHEDETLRRLYASVTACGQYVDELLTASVFQIARRSTLNVTSSALNRLRQARRNFLGDVAEYVQSQKTKLDTTVARRADEDAKLRLEGLLTSEWLIYSRSLFDADIASINLSDTSDRSAQFASFLAADAKINAVEGWMTAVSER